MLKLNALDLEQLQRVIAEYAGNAEEVINEVLHNYAGQRAQEEIRRLIPVSGKHWKGKAAAAKTSNSMRNVHGNLSETVTTQKRYQYLYFPNDGTSTKNHAGDQQFFEKGGDAAMGDIVERCILALIPDYFDN